MLLREGLNTHLDPDLTGPGNRATGCVARRREAYYQQIAERGTLNSRLARTNALALPVPLAA